jgi:hypothetical protein
MVMNCREFPLLYSAQVDGHADEREQVAVQKHLRVCPACRRRAAEMRCLISDLKGLAELRVLETQKSKPEMTVQIQARLNREARLQASYARQRADLLDLWRTRLLSQSIGTLVSMALFIVVLFNIFRPTYRAMALAQAASDVIWNDPSSEEIRHQALLKASLLQPPPPPIFSPSGELLNVGASLSADDIIMATVKVRKDGRASIDQIVVSPSDPSVMTRFSSVFTQQASFQPARRNQNTSAEAVVIFSKVNISG